MWLQKWSWSGRQRRCWATAWLAVTFVAAVTVQLHAQRVVDVQLTALGNPNICGDREVVVTVSLDSPLYTSDSLLLFEFAIEYNPSVLEFVSPLFIGTLAEDADYSGSGRIDSKTLRVYAFNVTRPFRGQGPLCGLLFRYRSECPDTSSVRFAYEPEKNQEAKILYGALRSAIVTAVEQPPANRSLTAQFPFDSIRLQQDRDAILPVHIRIPEGASFRQWRVTVATDSLMEVRQVRLAEVDSLQSVVIEQSPRTIAVQIESPSPVAPRTVSLEATVRWVGSDSGMSRAIVRIEPASCTCIAVVEGDSLLVRYESLSTIAESGAPVFTWHYDAASQVWKLCGPTEQAVALVQWDLMGRQIERIVAPTDPIVASASSRWSAVALYLRNGNVVRTILVR